MFVDLVENWVWVIVTDDLMIHHLVSTTVDSLDVWKAACLDKSLVGNWVGKMVDCLAE